jgi:hypothetical protein
MPPRAYLAAALGLGAIASSLSELIISVKSNTLQLEAVQTSVDSTRRTVLNIARETTANEFRFTASTGGSSAAKRDPHFKRFVIREYGLHSAECMVLTGHKLSTFAGAADLNKDDEQPRPLPPASEVICEFR